MISATAAPATRPFPKSITIIERLQQEIARKLGYRLVDHRLELYGIPLDQPQDDDTDAGKA
jgi:Fur family ferric uptake transcriptional regulator